MKTYKIDKGQTKWRPIDFVIKLIFGFRQITFYNQTNASQQPDYTYGDGEIDQDWMDWKKCGGVSFVSFFGLYWRNIFQKNRDAVMLGWRYNVENDTRFQEYCVYENRAGKAIKYQEPHQTLRVATGTKVALTIKKSGRREYKAYLYVASEGIDSVNPIIINTRFAPMIYSLIGLWYGGKNNAPGPFGGAAPKDMTTQWAYEIN